jgi:hypothetical protein
LRGHSRRRRKSEITAFDDKLFATHLSEKPLLVALGATIELGF